jgi:2-polyprenyl-3-methyl-5-hydroxy-6-metoxy-1,4-benzoquinol methylase
MTCIICEGNNWENIDHLKLKKVGMHMCKGCGFVSYPDKYKSEEEIKEHYRKSYRPAPQVGNLFTGERKLQYHSMFLEGLLSSWKERGITSPDVCEIGSAYGMFLNWFKSQVPDAKISGTELTESYRRVAFHEYGIELEEDFDNSKKYDMIVSYHVLEHQIAADKKLKEYAENIKKNMEKTFLQEEQKS